MEIDATGPDGNAFAIMGYLRRLMVDTGRRNEVKTVLAQCMAGSYDQLCERVEEESFGSIVVVNRFGEGE